MKAFKNKRASTVWGVVASKVLKEGKRRGYRVNKGRKARGVKRRDKKKR